MTAVTRAGFSRRNFLQVASLSALGLMGGAALTACGTKTTYTASGVDNSILPKYIPIEGLPADLPGTAEGVPAGFYSYPKPFRAVEKAPMSGGTISANVIIFGPPPNAREKNPTWRAIEERLGGKVDIQAVSADDYDTKFNTMVAGGDLPDLMLDNGSAIPNVVEFLEAKCADLTPLLSGEKIKDYPNLAGISEIFWKNTVQAGKIYSLPIPRSLTAGSGFYNATLLEKVGVTDTSAIKDKDEFYDIAKELTNPSQNRWALGSTKFGLSMLHHIFRTPYQWREEGGKMIRHFETDEYLAAIEFAAKLYKDGFYVPGSEGWTKSQMVNAFIDGKTAMIYDGLPAFAGPTGYAKSLPGANKENRALPFLPFGHDGGKAQTWFDNITFATVMLKKNEEEKLKEILRVANFLASPFGSEEYLMLRYGLEGTDYEMDATGNPIAKENSQLNTSVPWSYIAASQQVVFDPSSKEAVDDLHNAYSKLIPLAVANPCENLFSPKDATMGSTLAQPVSDATTAAIAGRGTIDQLKTAIADWKKKGGDEIRAEYEAAFAA